MKLVNSALGATRACPHCKSTILQSSTVCPACRHFLRFEAVKVPNKTLPSSEPLRVEATLSQPAGGNGCEYSLVVVVSNDRGEEMTRQVIAVGSLKPAEARTFALWLEVYNPERAQSSAPFEETAVDQPGR